MAELSKRGIYSIRLPNHFDFDIFCVNNARIEVKSSRLTQFRDQWKFHNRKKVIIERKDGWVKSKGIPRDRDCDFFVLVGFDLDRDPNYYVIPKEVIGTKISISITPNKGKKFDKFLNKWDLISNFSIN